MSFSPVSVLSNQTLFPFSISDIFYIFSFSFYARTLVICGSQQHFITILYHATTKAFRLFTTTLLLFQIQVMEDNSSAARANPTVMGGRSRARVGAGGRQIVGKNQQQQQRQTIEDLSGISSVVVTTDGMQHHQHDLSDENVVAVSGIPGN